VIAVALAAAGCESASSSPHSPAKEISGGTATWSEAPGGQPNWIWPFTPITYYSYNNGQAFQWLMYRPLYMFGDNGDSVAINYSLSPASAPAYKGTSVVINLKGWKWSDGETVSARDVVFWLNMESAEKKNFGGYTPGVLPDNLVQYEATGPDQVTLTLNRPYSRLWYTYNQLAEITPMPMAWDVTRIGAAPGSGGCTTDTAADHWAKCAKVWAFLTAQSKAPSSYASSPLWSVVDGPWKLSSYNTGGYLTFVPNKEYSGSPKPTLAAFKEMPYTADSAEYIALKAGQVDVGYIPAADLPPETGTTGVPATNPLGPGYRLEPAYVFGIGYYMLNFNARALGAVFRQLYIRQTLQYLVDQAGISRVIYRGYADATTGPVPMHPPSQWIPAIQQENDRAGPYPYSISKAIRLLASHGWSRAGGVMTCEHPANCGPGISKGEPLRFSLSYATGSNDLANELAVYKSDAAKAGIDIQLSAQSFNSIIGESAPCKPGPACTWEGLTYGGWNFNGPGFEPTGEPLFQTGAGSNSGSYSSPIEDQLIALTHASNSLSAFSNYATYTAQQLPVIWLPTPDNVQAVAAKLHNVSANPLGDLLPEYWHFTQ
jgi:peptide/nickel transport system substrate-binding protein